MKGQIFILVSILILIALILLRVSTRIPVEQTQTLFSDNYFNLQREFVSTVDLSLINKEDALEIKDNVDDFARFSRNIGKTKGYEEGVIYSFNYNGTKVVLGNFLGENLKDVNITLITASWSKSQLIPELSDGDSALKTFDPFYGWYVVKVESNLKDFSYSGYFGDYETMTQYFDISLSTNDMIINDILTNNKTITW